MHVLTAPQLSIKVNMAKYVFVFFKNHLNSLEQVTFSTWFKRFSLLVLLLFCEDNSADTSTWHRKVSEKPSGVMYDYDKNTAQQHLG